MRSSRPEVFYKKSILINYAKFRRQRPVPESLFQKGCRMEICHFIKKDTPALVFSNYHQTIKR